MVRLKPGCRLVLGTGLFFVVSEWEDSLKSQKMQLES